MGCGFMDSIRDCYRARHASDWLPATRMASECGRRLCCGTRLHDKIHTDTNGLDGYLSSPGDRFNCRSRALFPLSKSDYLRFSIEACNHLSTHICRNCFAHVLGLV